MSEDMTAEDWTTLAALIDDARSDSSTHGLLAARCETALDHYRSLLREAGAMMKEYEEDLWNQGLVAGLQDVRALLSRINDALGEG